MQSVRAVDIQAKVEFLRSPTSYPHNPHNVEVVETHMSWVFLAGERVYKLKKPVKYPFLDFSTTEARETDCREEVRLNQRLAPDVYLCTIPLTLEAGGRLALNGGGKVVDWLVKMRRLPSHLLLDNAIRFGAVSRDFVVKVADVLANFYEHAEPSTLTPEEHLAAFSQQQSLNRTTLSLPDYDLPKESVRRVMEAIDAFIAEEPNQLMARLRQGRIIEGHGDLRPEHICLSDPPVVIDCLEFNRKLRLVDPFDELALLGLECSLLGANWIQNTITERWGDRLGPRPSERLTAFYTAYRATLRARFALAHLLEPNPRLPDKWLPATRRYLAIAEQASVRIFPLSI